MKNMKILGLIALFLIMCVSVGATSVSNCVPETTDMEETGYNKLSCDISFTEPYDSQVRLTVDGDSREYSQAGTLIADFSYIDFNRGWLGSITDIGLTGDEDSDVNAGFPLTADIIRCGDDYCGKFGYTYDDAGMTEYFSINFQTEWSNEGVNYFDVNEYDGVVFDMNIDQADRHKVKLRLFGKALSDDSITKYCDTYYFDIGNPLHYYNQLDTGIIDEFGEFFVPFSTVNSDCDDFDYESVWKLTLMFNDIDQNSAGNILIRDVYLSKDLIYNFDDFDYELTSERDYQSSLGCVQLDPIAGNQKCINSGLTSHKWTLNDNNAETFNEEIRVTSRGMDGTDFRKLGVSFATDVSSDNYIQVINDFPIEQDFSTLSSVKAKIFQPDYYYNAENIREAPYEPSAYILDGDVYNLTFNVGFEDYKKMMNNTDDDFEVAFIIIDSNSDTCYSPFETISQGNIITKTDSISSFVGLCDKTKITSFGFQIEDDGTINNEITLSSDDLTSYARVEYKDSEDKILVSYVTEENETVFVEPIDVTVNSQFLFLFDEFEFIKPSESVNMEFEYRDDTKTDVTNADWYITVLDVGTTVSSGETLFDIDNTLSLSSQSTPTESGSLLTWITQTMDVTSYKDESFVKPSQNELSYFSEMIKYTKLGDLSTANYYASALNYEVVQWTDTDSNAENRIYYVARQKTGNNGWGTYIYNPNYVSDITMVSPHPREDTNTSVIATKVFLDTGSEDLYVATSHRSDTKNFIGESGEFFNVYHPLAVAFKNNYDPKNTFVEQHGFTLSKHPNYPDNVISDGSGLVTEFMEDLNDAFNDATGITSAIYDASDCNTLFSDTYCTDSLGYSSSTVEYLWDLKNRYSQYGKYVRDNLGEFVSIETSNTIRYSEVGLLDTFVEAFVSVFDGIPPTISGFSVDTTSFYTSNVMNIEVSVVDSETGVNQVFIEVLDENGDLDATLLSYDSTEGKYTGTYNREPGEYILTRVFATDVAGNLASSNQNIEFIINPNPDTPPPTEEPTTGGGGSGTVVDAGDDSTTPTPDPIDETPTEETPEESSDSTIIDFGQDGGGSDNVEIVEVDGTLEITPRFIDVLNIILDFTSDEKIWQHEIKTSRIIDECKVDEGFTCTVEDNKVYVFKDFTDFKDFSASDSTEVLVISDNLVGELSVTVRTFNLTSTMGIIIIFGIIFALGYLYVTSEGF